MKLELLRGVFMLDRGAVLEGVLLKERLRLKDLPPPLDLASEYSTQTADTKRKVKKSAMVETIN
ncbi:MAG: hypothetical protein JRD04_08590 [Deltaproteobacteria bacterium]|nr:hypothetical protein [Deltaproteobacteria bacterium]